VANTSGNSVSVIDGTSASGTRNTVTATIGVGSQPVGAAVDPVAHTLYVAVSGNNLLAVIDEITNTVSGIVAVGSYPTGVGLDPVTHTVYVANAGSQSISVVDGVTKTVTTSVGVGSYPQGVTVDPASHTVYVGNDGGSVSVIDGTTNTLTTSVGVGLYPDYLAVDLSTHAVYVANPGDGSVSVITPTPLQPQAITFLSDVPTAPVPGGGYEVTATGGGSGNAVTFSTASSACTIIGSTVTFLHAGPCVVDADQAGSSTYFAAPRAQQSFPIGLAAQAVSMTSTAPTAPVVGMTYPVTATGGGSGEAVTLSIASTTTNGACTVNGSTVTFVHPGSCVVNADQAGTADYTAATTVSQTVVVNPAATHTSLAVGSSKLTAQVTVPAPGAATPTGTVTFSVAGLPVGSASVINGLATLAYTVPSGATRQVAAVYSGSADLTGSSVSTARHDPSITATVRSAAAKTKQGWYRRPITVTFHCKLRGAPLTTACPAVVTFRSNGAGRSLTRTIIATDGGVATVAVSGMNLDRDAPSVSVGRVRNGATYNATPPRATCVGRDGLSGIQSCTVTRTGSGSRTTVVVTATDNAGNARRTRASYTTRRIYLQGATVRRNAFLVHTGHTYTIVVVGSARRPTYYDAAVYPHQPHRSDLAFHAAGHHRWTLGVTMTGSLRSHRYWNVGVKIAATVYALKIQIA
jgi:YVTN family beta-propeller protein